MGGEPEEMFRRAISELGGMKQFVKPGQKVVVKPNIGWDKVPELAGNTNPKLIEEIVRQCFAAGAKEVVVFDHTCDDWQKCYKNSGIEAAAKKAGAKVMPAHLESYYKPIDLPKGKKMKKAKVHEAILDCVHGGAGVILFDDADDGQVHHLFDLGDVADGVGADAHGSAHGGGFRHQGHDAALFGVKRLRLKCLTGDDEPAFDLLKQFFFLHIHQSSILIWMTTLRT